MRVKHYYNYPSLSALLDEPIEYIALQFDWYLYDQQVKTYREEAMMMLMMNSPKL